MSMDKHDIRRWGCRPGEIQMKRLSVLIAAVALLVGLASCGSGSGSSTDSNNTKASGPIKLGFAIGETGFMAPFDNPAKIAAEFAMDDINADGGAAGRKFTETVANQKSKPELSGDAATQVLGDGANVVVTSCDFDQGSPAALVAQNQGVLAFSTCAASTAFGPQGIGPLAFTMATAAPAEGATMAEYAFNDRGWKNGVTLLDDTIEFDKQSEYGFENRFNDLGGKLDNETFKQGDQSIASQINAIKQADPDFIYLASYMPGGASAMKQIRAAGIDVPILADEDVDGDY